MTTAIPKITELETESGMIVLTNSKYITHRNTSTLLYRKDSFLLPQTEIEICDHYDIETIVIYYHTNGMRKIYTIPFRQIQNCKDFIHKEKPYKILDIKTDLHYVGTERGIIHAEKEDTKTKKETT